MYYISDIYIYITTGPYGMIKRDAIHTSSHSKRSPNTERYLQNLLVCKCISKKPCKWLHALSTPKQISQFPTFTSCLHESENISLALHYRRLCSKNATIKVSRICTVGGFCCSVHKCI